MFFYQIFECWKRNKEQTEKEIRKQRRRERLAQKVLEEQEKAENRANADAVYRAWKNRKNEEAKEERVGMM